jgi:RNA polymerase sigma-70 factor (ECF subfamily)
MANIGPLRDRPGKPIIFVRSIADDNEIGGRAVFRILDATDGQPGFRPRRTLDDSPEAAREIRLAIARAKEGDREAVRLLYIRYSDNVYGYVRSIVKDEREAEDLTQQVFMKLMTVIGKYTDCGVPFSGWLLRLARNVALDHLRRRRPTPTDEVMTVDTHADEGARESARDLYAALATLPDEQRSVMVMRHIVGLSPPEIAEQMGRSESSIHGLHHRGRRALKQELVRLGSAPSTSLAC